MVRSSRWYLALTAVAVVVLAVPATREALTSDPLLQPAAWDEHPFLGPTSDSPRRDPAEVAAELGDAWAFAAAAECQPLGSAAQLALLDQAARLAPADGDLLLRRAALMVGAAFQRDDQPEARLLNAAERALADLPEAARGNVGALLLQAVVDSHWQDWPAVEAALDAAAEAEPRWPYEQVSQQVARLLRASGAKALEAGAQGTLGLLLPDLQAIRGMARAVAAQIVELRQAGHEPDAVAWSLRLAKAGAKLHEGETSLIAALVGVAVEWIAFDAGEPELVVPDSVKGTDDERWWLPREKAERFARRLEALGLQADAAWVRDEVERSRRLKSGLQLVRGQFPGLGPVNAPVRAAFLWLVLNRFCLLAAVLGLPLALLLCGAQVRPSRWLPWRPAEVATVFGLMLVLSLPAAGWAGANLLLAASQGPPSAAQALLALLAGAWCAVPLTLVVACWGLGLKHAGRTGVRGGWRRVKAAGHFASRAVAVPTLACQVLLLTLALLTALPMVWQRQRMADAFGQVFSYESGLVADAMAGRPLDLDGDRRPQRR